MTVYLVNIILILIYAMIGNFLIVVANKKSVINSGQVLVSDTQNKKQYLAVLIGIQLLFISAFRGVTVGADTANYIRVFHLVRHGGHHVFEPGYIFLNRVIVYIPS